MNEGRSGTTGMHHGFDVAEGLRLLANFVPEAYRQRFRSWEKRDQQTHVEFVQDILTHFSRWCSASSVESYDDLCDLIVLEQFKTSLPAQLATYITEKKVTTAAAAAVLADVYMF